MKRLILVIIILIVFTAAGAMPQVVYGAGEGKLSDIDPKDIKLLTPEEQAFMNSIYIKHGQLGDFLSRLEMWDAEVFNIKNRDYIHDQVDWLELHPPDCSIHSAPGIFEEYRLDWNNQVCPVYRTLHSEILFKFLEALGAPDLEAIPRLADQIGDFYRRGLKLGEVSTSMALGAEKLAKELIKKRKEAREKAGPLIEEAKDIIKEDTQKNKDSDKDKHDASEDIFDMDCFIATAAYGTPMATEIDTLRRFRDEFLLHNYPGRAFVTVYYATSPPVAWFISEHEVLRLAVRDGFVDPIVAVVELTEIWWEE